MIGPVNEHDVVMQRRLAAVSPPNPPPMMMIRLPAITCILAGYVAEGKVSTAGIIGGESRDRLGNFAWQARKSVCLTSEVTELLG